MEFQCSIEGLSSLFDRILRLLYFLLRFRLRTSLGAPSEP